VSERDRHARCEEIFARALEREPAGRDAFLVEVCGGDRELLADVCSLLGAFSGAEGFLERPVMRGLAQLTPPDEDQDPAVGRKVGPYRIERRLGAGGMGRVYLGLREGVDFEQRVAVKLVARGIYDRDALRRFRNECRALATLEHPHVTRMIDGGFTEDGTPYIVMEYVDGEPIDAYCDRHGLDVPARIRLFLDLCSAVAHAHQHSTLHRDIKPSNVLVDHEGRVKLADFGIARVIDAVESGGEAATVTVLAMMTPQYASPEQLRGETLSTASDLYALGVLLYRLLTGAMPFTESTSSAREREKLVLSTAPTRPSDRVRALHPDRAGLARRLRGDLDVIVLKALRAEPERRYHSAEHLAEDLRRHLEGRPVLARADTFGYRTSKFVRRNPVLVSSFVVIVALLIGFAATITRQLQRTEAERDRANREAQTARETVDFLQSLFGVADPSQARGASITAREILEQGVQRLQESFMDRPLVQAELLRTIGSVQTSLGLYEEARGPIAQALDIMRTRADVDSLELATTLENLANLERIAGNTSASLALMEEALGIRERSPEPNDLQLAVTLSRVAILKLRQLDYAGARDLILRSLAVRERVQGPDHPDAGGTLHTLGGIHFDLGEFEEARIVHERALRLQRISLGEDHPQIASALSSLAKIASEQQRHDDAERLMREAMELNARVLGPEHDAVGNNLSNLALVLRNAGRVVEAVEPARESVRILGAALGPDHPNVASALITLGQVLARTGRHTEGQTAIGEAIAILERRFPEEHPRVQSARKALADVQEARGGR
jgi:eukaryotic-like serine/threonine-protein kinase